MLLLARDNRYARQRRRSHFDRVATRSLVCRPDGSYSKAGLGIAPGYARLANRYTTCKRLESREGEALEKRYPVSVGRFSRYKLGQPPEVRPAGWINGQPSFGSLSANRARYGLV
ncbi:hypothetical protein [Spirosoma aerophilum]